MHKHLFFAEMDNWCTTVDSNFQDITEKTDTNTENLQKMEHHVKELEKQLSKLNEVLELLSDELEGLRNTKIRSD